MHARSAGVLSIDGGAKRSRWHPIIIEASCGACAASKRNSTGNAETIRESKGALISEFKYFYTFFEKYCKSKLIYYLCNIKKKQLRENFYF